MNIQFLGAAREVTGSKHLITTASGKKILLDCGMFQGKGLETDAMNRNLGFDPATLDHIILSHAHIDHSGLIPYAYRLGFRGSVITTPATRDLCAIMLADSAHIQESDVLHFNKRRAAKGLPLAEALYTSDDARSCMELFITTACNRKFRIDDSLSVRFTNTGHMLGSAVVSLEIKEAEETIRLAYTGDIGRPQNRILARPAPFPPCDYLICESTYGDRLHPEIKDAEKELLDIVRETCVDKRGKLIIPSFAIGRTQEIVYSLNTFFNEGLLPKVNIYVDSPLAVNATEIFRFYSNELNGDVQRVMETDPDPFGFNGLYYIKAAEESKKLNALPEPCIIISASGMMEAGRIKHHLANNISNPANTILIVGYCSPVTLGARIARGDKTVSIFGEKHEVRAAVKRLDAYSGHADYREMINYLACQDKENVKKLFLVHGDSEAQDHFMTELQQEGFREVHCPLPGDIYIIG
ncbi:MAG TPA: MBL fold metallo-hydrolase [Bacteroidales bacterium]|nr:MBL fold metallo-hydrolase [Bacteroidales bacterium]HSA44817.1 MBL fold metallo-hydrolase [Bacteroidales bacterium]